MLAYTRQRMTVTLEQPNEFKVNNKTDARALQKAKVRAPCYNKQN